MRMRTLKEAYAYIKETDPGTKISLTGLRTLAKQGRLPSCMVGRKYLIDIDRLGEMVEAPQEQHPATLGQIRPVRP